MQIDLPVLEIAALISYQLFIEQYIHERGHDSLLAIQHQRMTIISDEN